MKVSNDLGYTVLMWNKERIVRLLKTNNEAVERAMVALYNRQTRDEQASSLTRHDNQRGFKANHASKGSYYARWVNKGRRLTGRHLDNARHIALQYTRQLLEEAAAKEIDKQEDKREAYKNALADHNDDVTEPPIGSYAATARFMKDICPDFDWDAWKDEMKENEL